MNFKKSLNRIISATLSGTLALTMVSFPPVSIKAAPLNVKLDKGQVAYEIEDFEDFKQYLGTWQEWYNKVNNISPDPQPDVTEKKPDINTDGDQSESGGNKQDGNGQGGNPASGNDPKPDDKPSTEDKGSGGNSNPNPPDNPDKGNANQEQGSGTNQSSSDKGKPDTPTDSGNNGSSQTEKGETTPVQNDGKDPVKKIDTPDNKVAAPTDPQLLEPVAVLTQDVKIEITNPPYTPITKFSGEIRGEGHAIYTPRNIFETLDGATIINLQVCPGSFDDTKGNYSLAKNATGGTILINCFSADTEVPMIGAADGSCKFLNCYTQVQSDSNPETDNVGIKFLPSSQMYTRAFAYILTHPEKLSQDLKDKVEPKFAFRQGSYPIPLQKTSNSPVYKSPDDPLDYQNRAYLIHDSSDLLSLAMLTKLDMINSLRDKKPIFRQTQDITMSSEANKAFIQIGSPGTPFNAIYEGDGNMIIGLDIKGGIFGYISNAQIYNLGIENAKIEANDTPNFDGGPRMCTGTLADTAKNSRINKCYAVGLIKAGSRPEDQAPEDGINENTGKQIGGLIGHSEFNDISNCYTRVEIKGNNIMFGGGFAASDFKGDYKNIYSAGICQRENRLGGLFGYLDQPSTVINSYYDKKCDVSEDELNFAYAINGNNPVETFSTLTDRMQSIILADNLNSQPEIEKPFGWHASRNGRYPILYEIGSGRGVTPPAMYKVKLKQPQGSEITLKYNNEEYKHDGTEIIVPEGAEIQLSHKEEYTYKFKNYRAKIDKKGDRRFSDDKLVITGNTEITADIDKNGVTVSFSYGEGGYVTYDSLLSDPNQGVSNDSVTLEKGAMFEFEIFTDYGYKIKKVTYSAGTLHKISENKYRILRVANDGTVKIEFENIEKEELKEVVDDKTGDVVVKVNKQTDMIDQIAHNEGNKIQTEMGKATMLSGKVLNELYGEDVAIQLVMKDYRWDINGTTLTRTRNRNINMGVNVGKNKAKISEIATLQLENHEDVIPLNLVHRGDFPFTGYLTLNVGEEQQYRYASLFYYNPRSKVFEFQECNDVAENGDLTYRFTHASDYVIVIENEPIWDLAAGEGMTETETAIL